MDRDLIQTKLESLRRCVSRIESRRPATLEELESDHDIQDIISVNLERAVQVCVDIAGHIIASHGVEAPATMGESFERLRLLGLIPSDLASRMRKAVGFRNVSVHAYQSIDWSIVYQIVHKHLHDFERFAVHVVRTLDAG